MDKRTIIFIVLAVAIWFAYIQFVAPVFIPKPQPEIASKEAIPESQKQDGNEGLAPSTEAPNSAGKEIPGEFKHPQDIPLKVKKITNAYFEADISNKGAAIESLILKQFKANKGGGQLTLIDPANSDRYSLSLKLLQPDINLQDVFWETVQETDSSIKFRYTTPGGLAVYKTFSSNKYNYSLDFSITLENLDANPVTTTLQVNGIEKIPYEAYDFSDVTGLHAYVYKDKWYVKQKPVPAKVKGVLTLTQGQDNVAWIGIANKYFATILVPVAGAEFNTFNYGLVESSIAGNLAKPNAKALNLSFYLQTKEFSLKAGETKQLDFLFFGGPKKTSELEALVSFGFDKLLSYGWFGFISKILLWILQALFSLFGNYGFAIIFLTIIVKLILFPITKKGQVSMYQLQKLAPRIKALQEQYKNDKKKLGEEQLKLWKEYGVNPLSGCLPMLFQIPVFFGLYWALAQSFELRQAPFMFWINDLSQPDQLCALPFTVLGATQLHVLPLVMTISWFIQSLTQPKSPDPQTRQQQKIFLFMPLVFGILFYNVPSGLTLYWFISTLLGILEQLLIKKYYFK